MLKVEDLRCCAAFFRTGLKLKCAGSRPLTASCGLQLADDFLGFRRYAAIVGVVYLCAKAGFVSRSAFYGCFLFVRKTQPVSFVNWQTLKLEALSLEFQPSQRREHRCNFEPSSSHLDGFLPDRALGARHLSIRDLLPRILNKRGSVYTQLEANAGFRIPLCLLGEDE